MTDLFKPTVRNDKSPLSSHALDGAISAIMDDTVYTMDDSRILMGGGKTVSEDIQVVIRPDKPIVGR